MRPSATGTITVTNPNYQVYHGVDITVTKRYSDRWQLAGGLTIQDSPAVLPSGIAGLLEPDRSHLSRRGQHPSRSTSLKLNGSYELPWGIVAAGNLNMFQGASRTLTMDGPGNVYGGVNAAGRPTTISYTTLEFQDRNDDAYSKTRSCSTWACRRSSALARDKNTRSGSWRTCSTCSTSTRCSLMRVTT